MTKFKYSTKKLCVTKLTILLFLLAGLILTAPEQLFAARVAGAKKPVTATEQPAVGAAPQASAPLVEKTQPVKVEAETANRPQPAPPDIKEAANAAEQPEENQGGGLTVSKKATKYVTIDFDNVDIQVFVKFISELTGRNFIIDDKVKGKVTVISPKKIAVEDVYRVFESVLEVNGFTTVPSGDVTKIIPAMEARGKYHDTLRKDDNFTAEDRIATQIIPLRHANADEMKRVLDPLVSRTSVIVSYSPTGMLIISDVLSNIKKLKAIIESLDIEGVGSQITYIPLQYASATDVVKSLTSIFQQQQKGVSPIKIVGDDRTNSLIIRASESETAHIRDLVKLMDSQIPKTGTLLHLYRLQNANAEDLAKVLMNLPKDIKDPAQKGKSPVLSKDVNIIPDKSTNTLVITAERGDYLILEDVIKKLDTSRPMVYIEALIMEVSVNKDFKLGVEWRGLKDTGTISGLSSVDAAGNTVPARSGAFAGSGGAGGSGNYSLFPGFDPLTNAITGFPGGYSLGILGAGIRIGNVLFPSIGAVAQAYQTDQDVSILSTPQLLTIDNEEAEINVGENRPYLTRQESSTVSTNVNYSSYEYRDVGVILKIVPHINEDGFVRLKVDQQVTRVVQAESTVGLPVTRKRMAKTTVVVKDGETVVIGGLVGDTTDSAEYKLPCLGNIPVFGWMFKTMTKNKEKSNLFVFITPRIIRNQQDATAVAAQKKQEIGEIKDGVIKMINKNQVSKEEKKK